MDVIASAPVPVEMDQAAFMSSKFQTAKATAATPAQGKSEGKPETWKEFLNKLPKLGPENKIEQQLLNDNKLYPDNNDNGHGKNTC